jgi:hypothetical protein
MKNLIRVVFVMSFAALLGASALAQTAVVPPPRPGDSGPSLAVTMEFIQAKLSEQGSVNYMSYYQDSASGQQWTEQFSDEISNVTANPSSCRIDYHWKITLDGAVTLDQDAGFSLSDVQDLAVMTGEMHQKKVNTAAGVPTQDSRIDPPVFVLVVRRTRNAENPFVFTEEEMANRVAKAMVHAVELCGGGQKAEPF